jgi:hypothetical protein
MVCPPAGDYRKRCQLLGAVTRIDVGTASLERSSAKEHPER